MSAKNQSHVQAQSKLGPKFPAPSADSVLQYMLSFNSFNQIITAPRGSAVTFTAGYRSVVGSENEDKIPYRGWACPYGIGVRTRLEINST